MSGHGPFEIGDYQSCRASHSSRFCLANAYFSSAPFPLSLGLCLPKNCSDSELKRDLAAVLSFLVGGNTTVPVGTECDTDYKVPTNQPFFFFFFFFLFFFSIHNYFHFF
jgi:hypothetical protein